MRGVRNVRLLLLTVCGCVAISTLSAQDVSSEQIYQSVSSYTVDRYKAKADNEYRSMYLSYTEPSLYYRHSLQVGTAFPSLISYIMHDLYELTDNDASLPYNFSNSLAKARYYRAAEYWWPCLSAEYQYNVLNWLSVGAKAVFGWRTQAVRSVTDNKVLYRDYMLTAHTLFDMRFSWLHRDHISLYSSIGVGVTSYVENDEYMQMLPSLDLVYIGMSFGGRVYGFCEFGGLAGGSLRGGLGVRF